MRTFLLSFIFVAFSSVLHGQYAIVAPANAPETEKPVIRLLEKYKTQGAYCCLYTNAVEDVLQELRRRHPRAVVFVQPTAQAGRDFVRNVHQLMRQIDSDPYTDALWGIITGPLLETVAREDDAAPLTIRRTLGNTHLALDRLQEATLYDELTPGRLYLKNTSSPASGQTVTNATTEIAVKMAEALNRGTVDFLVTSAHATERGIQVGYRFPAGEIRMRDEDLTAISTQKEIMRIRSTNPKVWLACGNCLTAHIDHPTHALACGMFGQAGVRQMIGYTVPTWFGYMGWGIVDYFIEQPGRFTFAEAFLANQHALIHKLEHEPESKGLLFDRDVVAFYGDPLWAVRLATGDLNWEQTLTNEGSRYTFTLVPRKGKNTFLPINTNGSQRGFRPVIHFPEHRLANIRLIDNGGLAPVIADDFILVPLPEDTEPKERYTIIFEADAERELK